jgi:hypothetical protein
MCGHLLSSSPQGYETQDIKRIDPAVLSSVLSYALAPASRAFYRVNAIRTLSAGTAHPNPEPLTLTLTQCRPDPLRRQGPP